MQVDNDIALKEWAVVCRALANGWQTILLRKGGIDEGREGFGVAHTEFWLFPTRFHKQAESLVPAARDLWQQTSGRQPAPGIVPVEHYAVVVQVWELKDERQLAALRDHHVLSDDVVHQRFQYRRAGLFVLLLQVHGLGEPHAVCETPNIAGCKSWVALPRRLPTAGAKSVLSQADFSARRNALLNSLSRE